MRANNSRLNFLGNCPICSKSYQQKTVSVIDEGKETVVLHIDCQKCESSMLLTINSVLKSLVTTIGVPTDITKKDIKKIKKVSRITSDDVIELHTFLER